MTEPLRVLEILASGAIGGGATHLRDLVTGLDARAIAPVVALSEDGPLAPSLRAAGLAVRAVPMQRRFNVPAIAQLVQLIRRERIELVHCHGTRAALAGTLAAQAARVPVVYTVHGWSYHSRGTRSAEAMATTVERQIARLSRQVICVSRADAASGLRHGVLATARHAVIPNGVACERFVVPGDRRLSVRRRLGLGPDDRVVLQLARLEWQKQQGTLLEAAALLAERFADLKVVLVGDGRDRRALEAKAARLGLAARVVFAGARSDVADCLAACDAMALPSLWEGLPIAVLEAMAAGVAVVASDIDGNRELLEGDHGGLLVRPSDPADLARGLEALLANPELRARLARRGQARVQRDYRLDQMVRATAAVYQSVAGPRA